MMGMEILSNDLLFSLKQCKSIVDKTCYKFLFTQHTSGFMVFNDRKEPLVLQPYRFLVALSFI